MNKIVIILTIIVLLIGCAEKRSVEELQKLFDGVFWLDGKYNNEPNSLHYIIFNQDSTYIHKFIQGDDTLWHKGTWKLGRYSDGEFYFRLRNWKRYGEDPAIRLEIPNHMNPSPILKFGSPNDTWAGIRLYIDSNYDFDKITKEEAAQLGIKEEGVKW